MHIKIGAVGLGRLGRLHAENIAFRISQAELTAVCSIVKEEVDTVKSSWNIPYGYYDFEEMLQNKELNAIVIASSSTEHCRQISQALAAGFHVFCEKPLGVGMEEIRLAQQVVTKHSDKVFQLGFMRRYDTSYAYAKKKIEEGFIGEPILIRCYGLDPVSAINGAIAFAENSGGLFSDMAVHDFDLARWYLNSEANKVSAIGGCYAYQEFARYGDIDNGAALIQFKNNTMGIFYASRTCNHGYHIETEIVGTKGSVRIGTVPYKNLVTITNEQGVTNECVCDFLERFEVAYLNEIQNFVDCIIHNKKPDITVEDGVKSVEIAYAANKSLATGQTVYLD
ncbi:scyllo-inositol 2-dehydrogenase (NAD(+)) [Sporomusa silvacetica DSM 10669]|uniref:Scyllo-inositol 2-dehydrogenase (NAD(+)) n=1 Tax=Sporomusa silvacetica DSM 10669 TaxID=1123289 RepID=A0ABZ3IMD7_9FIRM|nr:Gfo/Idh/MocA family oxidoreductase [Sporomusa silvacetica]OZC14342.1 scyllo-inositol 2-dehydrogenase (NAD(+)) [Sporomusa silvacetica DSM 10669]